MGYDNHKRPSQLADAIAIANGDWLILQKDGENTAKRIPVALLAAHLSGVNYKADSVDLTAGDNVVAFSSALPNNQYKVYSFVRNAAGNTVSNEVKDDHFTINGFPIWVKSACKLTYFAIPIK